MILQYVTITTREAIMLALGMGIFADILAAFSFVVLLSHIRGKEVNDGEKDNQARES